MSERNAHAMLLIIDGHGSDATTTFSFKRPSAYAASLYSYTASGISAQGDASVSKIKTALSGNIPAGYFELQKSRIGGTLIKDRYLSALKSTDIPFNQFPADFLEFSNDDRRIFYKPDFSILYFSYPLDSNKAGYLSQIVASLPSVPLDIIWAPCRGAAGAAGAAYASKLRMRDENPEKYIALRKKCGYD
jgi:hypothetical protein